MDKSIRSAIGSSDRNRPLGEKTQTKTGARIAREVHSARVKARGAGMTVQQTAQELARRFGLRVTAINYKGQGSTERKYRDEIGDARSANKKNGTRKRTHDIDGQIRDLTRNTIIYHADKQRRQGADLKRHMEGLAKKGTLTDAKSQDFSRTSGYKGFISHVRTGKRAQGEIQVLSDKMIYAKEKGRIARSLIGKKRYREIMRETKKAPGQGHYFYEKMRTEKDPKKKAYWERKSREYYSHFY